jgi:hypothetical protein
VALPWDQDEAKGSPNLKLRERSVTMYRLGVCSGSRLGQPGLSDASRSSDVRVLGEAAGGAASCW